MTSPSIRRTRRLFLIALIVTARFSLSSALAQEPTAPGLHDLVVYRPGGHEQGLPPVEFVPRGHGLEVQVQPTVHVHRYYYSGDKEFQGPIIQGGPTIVVANHPKTGERMYVDAILPPGAPRIAYCKTAITYVYPRQRVIVKFCHFPFSTQRVVVKYCAGEGIGRKAQEFGGKVLARTKQHFHESTLAQSAKEAVGGLGKLTAGARESAATFASQAIDGAKSAVSMLPGVKPLVSMAEEGPQRRYLDTVRQAARRQERLEVPFVHTNQ